MLGLGFIIIGSTIHILTKISHNCSNRDTSINILSNPNHAAGYLAGSAYILAGTFITCYNIGIYIDNLIMKK